MKCFISCVVSLIFLNSNAQQPGSAAPSDPASINRILPAGGLNSGVNAGESRTQQSSSGVVPNPFVGGLYAPITAKNSMDSSQYRDSVNQRTVSKTVSVPGGNDTTFNINSIGTGSTTVSGAVDRSGQAQFGQTNWGRSRSTVGEGQWTVPPPITASFNNDFPGDTAAYWTRNTTDTSIYSARSQSGANWIITNYNTQGVKLQQRTEFPLLQPPRPVVVFLAKQPAAFKISAIFKLEIQGKPEVFEVLTGTGKVIYLDNNGMEVAF